MANVRIELNHSGIEAIEDAFSGRCLEKAEQIAGRANSMKSDHVADYNAGLRSGKIGGRHYAVVSADATSTKRDNAKHNTLLKAMG